MKTTGSQKRDTLAESGMILAKRVSATEVILQNEEAKYELWVASDDFAGYVIEIDGIGYEFVRTMRV